MASRDRNFDTGDADSRRRWLVRAAGVIALVVIAFQVWARWPTPQMPTDEQVFTTVDALFTAVTAHDATRLSECDERLKSYHADGRISDAVAARLSGVVQQAHAGEWEPAARTLYDFILAQRGGS